MKESDDKSRRNRAGEEFVLAKTGTTAAVPAGDTHPSELRDFFVFGLHMTILSDWGSRHLLWPEELFRCDAATYVDGSSVFSGKKVPGAIGEQPLHRLLGRYDYAVRAISASHNRAAGVVYSAWLAADHILERDPFWVRIVP